MTELNTNRLAELARSINEWAQELGFNGMGIANSGLEDAGDRLNAWLAKGWHGEMSFMSRNTEKRIKPELLIPEVKRIISVRLNYWPEQRIDPSELLKQQDQAYIARYALGRDYHRLMRRRLQHLANRISDEIGPFHYRAFVDSAPVMEKPLASAAGLGWIGKHTNLVSPNFGFVYSSDVTLGEKLTKIAVDNNIEGCVEEHATFLYADCTLEEYIKQYQPTCTYGVSNRALQNNSKVSKIQKKFNDYMDKQLNMDIYCEHI